MLSIQKRFLFIHVPKTGGNSLQNILRHYSEDEIVILAPHQDGIERFEVRNKQYPVTKHSTLAHYQAILDRELYQSLFKFATIRNPWDMMISFYFSPHRGVQAFKRQQFLALIRGTAPLRHYITEKPQPTGGAPTADATKLTTDSRRLDENIDFLIRFEHLESDFRTVCERLDIPFSPLPQRNRSVHAHYSTYYDDELREIVGAKFHEEIALGNYTFESLKTSQDTFFLY